MLRVWPHSVEPSRSPQPCLLRGELRDMSPSSRMPAAVVGCVGMVVAGSYALGHSARAQDAAPARPLTTPQLSAAAPASPAPARALLAKYCVTCHNERLKTAGLALDQLDPDRVEGAAEIWE